MHRRKQLLPEMMYQVHTGDLVSKDNFYRILDRESNLFCLYKATRCYDGDEGQESIDPVVFFKICFNVTVNVWKNWVNKLLKTCRIMKSVLRNYLPTRATAVEKSYTI